MSITLKGLDSAAIAQHEAAADPHPQYLTETEADAKYALIGSGGGTGGDPAGTAAALVADHEAAADPHPQYLTQSEGDALYAPKTHSHTSSQISDFSEAVEDLIGGSIVAGAGVSVAYNDGTGKTTISASGGGGGGYAVQTRNGSLANQVHAFGLPAVQSSYGFDAYALKEEAGLTNQSVAVESFDSGSSVNYEQTGALVWDGQVRPYTGEVLSVNTPLDSWLSTAPVVVGSKSIKISGINASTVTPVMASNTAPAGYTVFASSFYESGYEGFKVFDKIVSGDSSMWNTAIPATLPQHVGVSLPDPEVVVSYDVVARGLVQNGGNPSAWRLEGSNDGSNWTILHTVTGMTAWTSNQARNFTVPDGSRAPYSMYRLVVTAVNAQNYVSIAEINLYKDYQFLAVDANGEWYKLTNGAVEQVQPPTSPEDFNINGSRDSGVISNLGSVLLEPIRIVAASSGSVVVNYTPYAQIAIPNSLLGAGAFSQINSATVTATQTGNGKVRLAVSRDLVNWHAWNGSAWISVGTLSADTTSAEALLAGGMAPATVGGITVAQWAQFFAAAEGGLPDKIAFAYALDVPDPATDAASINNVALNVNYNSAWLKQTPAQVEIRWYKDQVTFKTITAGNYKLAYQTP